jgi:exopolyphosphatase/guanosine-5'-triphosphate,3'-diphosphate pyrophosphatase
MSDAGEFPFEKNLLKFAAIDIGSNAVRLLFCNVYDQPNGETVFKKSSLIRVPIRLGEDSFANQIISPKKEEQLVKTMIAFRNLIDVSEVISYRACATSAMREARNSQSVVDRILLESGIKVEVIEGQKEAEIIYANHTAELINSRKTYLYIDVGGGSTELTLFSNGKICASKSFNIGTIRLLKGMVSKERWQEMKEWIVEATAKYENIAGIGSGGNINKLVGLARKKDDRQISYSKLKELYSSLSLYTVEERITLMGMNPDRADVILPATEIFITVMKTANIQKIMVPQIGLSDGIIHLLYENFMEQSKLPLASQ